VIPESGAELASPPTEFAWPPQPGAEAYRVQLFDASGAVVWRSERLAQARFDLPLKERGRLERDRVYFWTVEVEGPLDKRRLGPFTFRLGAP
jgi:hypothetical protein